MRRIAVINQKGGVGKTTTTANLGAALAIQGRRVVVVDMDAQANLSLALGVEAEAESPTSYTLLMGSATFAEALRPTKLANLSLVASHLDLSGAELELASAMGREYLLRDALREWEAAHRAQHGTAPADYVLFDCPPSLGLLSINALAASGEVLITLQTEFLAMQGMSKLVEVVQLLKRRLNPALEVGAILPCLYDSRLVLAREVLGEIRRYFPGLVLDRPIRSSVKLAEAPSFGQTIFEYADDSHAADDYRAAAQAIVAREGRDPELAGLPPFDASKRLPKPATARVPPPPRPRTKVVQDAAEALVRLAPSATARVTAKSDDASAMGTTTPVGGASAPSSDVGVSDGARTSTAVRTNVDATRASGEPAPLDATGNVARPDDDAATSSSSRLALAADVARSKANDGGAKTASNQVAASRSRVEAAKLATPSTAARHGEIVPRQGSKKALVSEARIDATARPVAKAAASASTAQVPATTHGSKLEAPATKRVLAASNDDAGATAKLAREPAAKSPKTRPAHSQPKVEARPLPVDAPTVEPASSLGPKATKAVAKAHSATVSPTATPSKKDGAASGAPTPSAGARSAPRTSRGKHDASQSTPAPVRAASHATTAAESGSTAKRTATTAASKHHKEKPATTIEPSAAHVRSPLAAQPSSTPPDAKNPSAQIRTTPARDERPAPSSRATARKTEPGAGHVLAANEAPPLRTADEITPAGTMDAPAEPRAKTSGDATPPVAAATTRSSAPRVAKSASTAPKAARDARPATPAKPAAKGRDTRPSSPPRAAVQEPDDLPPLPPDAFEILSAGS